MVIYSFDCFSERINLNNKNELVIKYYCDISRLQVCVSFANPTKEHGAEHFWQLTRQILVSILN